MLDKKFDEAVANSITEWVKREVPSATEREAAEAGARLIELLQIIRRIEKKKKKKKK